MTHKEKIQELKNTLGNDIKWKVLKEHGVERCCAYLTNRKTHKTSRCRKAINWEFGKQKVFSDENSSYCENHAKLMEAINSKYNMSTYK
mgnify:CR=1 FL=1|jgi:hypothetical protein